MKVFKYPLIIEGIQEITMPQGAQILTVQTQRGAPCIWALVNPEAPAEKRRFRLAGTGHDVETDLVKLKYIGTFQVNDGDFIGHLFEFV